MANKKTDERQTSAIAEPERSPKAPQPVQLRTAHDFTLATHALESHVLDLKKLAEKNSDAGYSREANAIQADANAIEFHILPAFRAQRELPLVTIEQLEKEIAGAFRVFVMRAFNGLDDPKIVITPESIRGRCDRLLKTLTEKTAMFARDTADRAYNEGMAARGATGEALAIACVRALKELD